MPGTGHVVCGGHAVGVFLTSVALLRQEQLIVVGMHTPMVTAFLVEDYIIKTNSVALWIDMQLANSVGLVAAIGKSLG